MDCWEILGIKPTLDKTFIKQAYMEKLNLFHPEENPDGFQTLRLAYETALKEGNNTKHKKDSSLDIWMKKVKKLYNTFSMRIDPECWKTLLQDEACFQIDMTKKAGFKLLYFLADNSCIPHNVWQVLDEHFNWSSNKDELYIDFSRGYIDFIMERLKYDDILKYDLFIGNDDSDYTKWFELYYKLASALERKDIEIQKKIIDEIKILGIEHPYLTFIEVKHFIQTENIDKARNLTEALLKNYPLNPDFVCLKARLEYSTGNIEEAKKYYKEALKIDPKHTPSYVGFGDCAFASEEFEEALEYYKKVSSLYPYDKELLKRIDVIKVKQASICIEKKLKEDIKNIDVLFDLAYAYYDMKNYDECKIIAEKIIPSAQDKPRYYDLMGNLNSELRDYEKSLTYFKQSLDICTEDKKRAYIYKQIGIQYYFMRVYDKALYYYNNSLNLEPADVDALYKKAEIFIIMEKYNEAIDICDKQIEIDEEDATFYAIRAKAYYEMGDLIKSMDNCDRVMNISPCFEEIYILQIKIYYDSDEFELAMDIVEDALNFKIESGEIQLYKGKILNCMRKIEESEKVYLKLIKDEPQNDEAYYDLATINYDKENYDDAIKYVRKSIKLKDEIYKHYLLISIYKKEEKFTDIIKECNLMMKTEVNLDKIYSIRGLAYLELGKNAKAIKDYKKVLEIDPNNRTANSYLAELYENQQNYNQALEHYNRQLQIDEDDHHYVNRGWCYINLKNLQDAEKDFKSALKINDKNVYAYNGLTSLYIKQEKYSEAIKSLKKILECEDEDCGNAYIQSVYHKLGECYEELKDYEQAERYYTEGIKRFPTCEFLYLDRGVLYSNLNKTDNAIKDYKKAIKLNPNYDDAYNNLGAAYEDIKNYDDALKFYKKTLEINPNNIKANENMGGIYLNIFENYPAAVYFYTQQLEFTPDNPFIYMNRAKAYANLGKLEKSKADYNSALSYLLDELDDGNHLPCIYKDIGFCYEQLGNFVSANEFYKIAIKIKPSLEVCDKLKCHKSYFRLGRIEEAKGNLKKALTYYNKAKKINPEEHEYQEAVNNIVKNNNFI